MTELSQEAAPRVRPPVRSIEDLVGNTPMLGLPVRGAAPGVRVLAKLEMFNPLSNVKDRPALAMLREAVRTGQLPATGGTVIEVSSGSTGISLAALCAVHGHHCVIVMPDNATEERRQILRTFGAEIVTVPHEDGLLPAFAHAEELQRSMPGSWLAHQDRNQANLTAHYTTTGPEIWAACGGQVDVLVCGVGTGGTLTGAGRYLKERRDVHLVAVEPARSAVLSGGEPGPHGIPGIGAGYVSEVMDVESFDEVISVSDEAALLTTREVCRSTGLLVGISSGAAAHAAMAVAQRERWAGATIVTIFPDTGERYLSMTE